MHKTYANWSSGKDSCLALYKVMQDGVYEVTQLLTTVNKDHRRVSMHGLSIALLEEQAKSIGLPLKQVAFAEQVTMSDYSRIMENAVLDLTKEGFTHAIFGDIFLEDLRKYRDDELGKVSVTGVYPLWKKDTKATLKEFLSLGFKAITVCVNAKLLDKSFCGRKIDQSFIDDLPAGIDPCGENGEFHTFVYDGPIFKEPVNFTLGEHVLRTYDRHENDDDNCFQDEDTERWDTAFWYCDLIAATTSS